MSALMLHPLVYRMRTTPGCFYWIIQILSLQFCYISALKVDSLYSIEKLCCTLQGLKARFYSGAFCSQRLVQQFITIEWRSQPPVVIPRGILWLCLCLCLWLLLLWCWCWCWWWWWWWWFLLLRVGIFSNAVAFDCPGGSMSHHDRT